MLVIILFLTGYSLTVFSESPIKLMTALTYEGKVKVYLRDAAINQVVSYQIGNEITEEILGYLVADDAYDIRTLIMVDNSFSIPKNYRSLVKDEVKAIIDAHGPNEKFRLATFDENIVYLSDQYSNDYTSLKNVVDSIENKDQETYLTDVLYSVIDELNGEKYQGYTRIIIFSDGVDNKPIGVTREELNKKIEESQYPIYTIGIKTGKNDSELENMFAISRLASCEYFMLEESETGIITETTAKDADMTVYEITIPEEAKIGGKQNSKLTFTDGTEIIFAVDTPFRSKTEPEPVPDPEPEPKPEPQPQESEPVEIVEEEKSNSILTLGLIAFVVIAIIIVAAIIIIIFRKKRRPEVISESDNLQPEQQYDRTEIMSNESKHVRDGTVLMTPEGTDDEVKKYRFTLTDAADSSRSFRCELINEIKVGRQADNDIVLSDDTAVHGHHAKVIVEDGTFYITDLKDVKNHSSVNGVALKPGIRQLIVTNSKITIGRHTYVVSIS